MVLPFFRWKSRITCKTSGSMSAVQCLEWSAWWSLSRRNSCPFS